MVRKSMKEMSFTDEQGRQSTTKSVVSTDQSVSLKILTKKTPIQFKDFEVTELLGEGSFGKVFRAVKRDNGKNFAMKSMKKQFLIGNN